MLSFHSRYLYWYLKRIGRSKEERFPVLKDLVEHDATDELAIEFIEIIREKGLRFFIKCYSHIEKCN